MSLVTRCTSCGTLFKIVADQLKISDGWVRCGKCATIFDAQSNIVSEVSNFAPARQTQTKHSTQAPSTQPKPAVPLKRPIESLIKSPIAPKHDEIVHESLGAELQDDISSEIASFRSSKFQGSGMLAEYARNRVSVQTTASEPLSSKPSTVMAQPSRLPLPPLRDNESHPNSDAPKTFSPSSSIKKSQLPESISEQSSPSQFQGDAVAAAPSFVVQAERAQRWRSPWVRLGLSLLCMGLIAMLAAQIALNDKDRLAAHWPQAKPWLEKFCSQLGCQVKPFQHIEAIAVDASSFNRVNKNSLQLEALTQSYRLAVTLKNTSTIPVALPHVELSLQDAQDQSVLRRVLSPADLGSSLQVLGAAQDLSGSLTLQIDTTQLAGSRIQGYRVLAFYP